MELFTDKFKLTAEVCAFIVRECIAEYSGAVQVRRGVPFKGLKGSVDGGSASGARTLWPRPLRVLTTISSARLIGGWGDTKLASSQITPNDERPDSSCDLVSRSIWSRQGSGWTIGSLSQGCCPRIDVIAKCIPSMDGDIGPRTERTVFCPSIEFAMPSYGSRPLDGFSPKTPLVEAGMRMLPPMSVPNPRGLPLSESKAPSPPELPPLLKWRFLGLNVYRIMLLKVSPVMSVDGTLVLQYSTAPRFRNSRTISLSKTFAFGESLLPSNVPIQPT